MYTKVAYWGVWLKNRLSISGKISLSIIFTLVIITVIYHFSPLETHRLPSGTSLEAPTLSHPFGTDDLGIDLLAQICYGTGISLTIGIGTALIAGLGGTLLGMVAGYFGKWVDHFITGLSDTMLCIPRLPLMIVMGAFFGTSIQNIIFVLALVSWAGPARIARSKLIALKQERYIAAARSYGAGFFQLSIRHFFPALFPISMVSMLKIISAAIIAEASLSFLGLGDPTSKSWGIILNRSINFDSIYFTEYWKWWIVIPLFFLILLVISFAMLGRDIERLLNTKE